MSVDQLLDMVRDWRPMVVVAEAGGLKNAIGPFLKERMNQRKIYTAVETIPSRHVKEIRAQSIAGRMAVRGLFLPAHAEWLEDFRSEVLTFPTSTDDQVDCLSAFWPAVGPAGAGSEPAKKEPPKVLSTNPELCTVTLSDMFQQAERR